VTDRPYATPDGMLQRFVAPVVGLYTLPHGLKPPGLLSTLEPVE
jgi:hypothetical protein